MGIIIVKPEKDEDFYVLWSTGEDRPVGYGTRKELVEYDSHRYNEHRFERADLFVSSCMMCTTCWSHEDVIVRNCVREDTAGRKVKMLDFADFCLDFLDTAYETGWTDFMPPIEAQEVVKKYGIPFDYED